MSALLFRAVGLLTFLLADAPDMRPFVITELCRASCLLDQLSQLVHARYETLAAVLLFEHLVLHLVHACSAGGTCTCAKRQRTASHRLSHVWQLMALAETGKNIRKQALLPNNMNKSFCHVVRLLYATGAEHKVHLLPQQLLSCGHGTNPPPTLACVKFVIHQRSLCLEHLL